MRKLLSILLVIMIIISIIQIQSVYAMYKDEITGTYTAQLGNWNIKLNDTLISSGGNQSVVFDIPESSVKYVENDNVAKFDQEGNEVGAHLIAPDSEAYFTIKIDPENTDVSVKYTIGINTPTKKGENTALNDVQFEITKIECSSYDRNTLNVENTTSKVVGESIHINKKQATDIVLLDEVKSGKIRDYNVYFKWKNDDANDYSEYKNSEERVKFSIPVTVKAEQYIAEDILDEQNITLSSGYYYDGEGDSSSANSRFIKLSPITCKPNTTYKFSSNLSIYTIWYFSETGKIERKEISASEIEFTTPENCTNLRISLNNTSGKADTNAFEWAALKEIDEN